MRNCILAWKTPAFAWSSEFRFWVVYEVWLLKTNLGCTITTFKRKRRHVIGTRRNHDQQRKHVNRNASVKNMFFALFRIQGINRAQFLPGGVTVNPECYRGLLEHLRNDLRRKRPENGRTCLCGFMAALVVAHLFSSASFWLIKIIIICPHPPKLAGLDTQWFLPLPRN